ncbi:hypothetical protein AWC11_07675 [Mycobacterium interjectum]|nr:hypothetical protein AWC11_07675 [Mycobacterium interjectum]
MSRQRSANIARYYCAGNVSFVTDQRKIRVRAYALGDLEVHVSQVEQQADFCAAAGLDARPQSICSYRCINDGDAVLLHYIVDVG